ncbi:MAG: hypothetical protein FWC19_10340 [Treponema sp.]|nr:hypothetical protein [Treponema sp.]
MANEQDFFPSETIGKEDRQKQAEWAEGAANMTRYASGDPPGLRIFDGVFLYCQNVIKQYRDKFPEPDRDYSGAPYWLWYKEVEGRTKEVIPMHSIQDIADFFYWNTDYWEKK